MTSVSASPGSRVASRASSQRLPSRSPNRPPISSPTWPGQPRPQPYSLEASVNSRPHPPNGRRSCTVAGCGRPHHARGLCLAHYQRQRRHGNTYAAIEVGAQVHDTLSAG